MGVIRGNIQILWKYRRSADTSEILERSTLRGYIQILWKYPVSMDIIRISHKYLRSVDTGL